MIRAQIKKFISFILTGILLFSGNVITVAAQEQIKTETQEKIALPQNIGDSVVIFDNGTEKWSVKLISEQDSKTKGTDRVAWKIYIFEHEVLFVTVEAFKVGLRCDWIEDGDNSIITDFQGEISEVHSLFSCEWIGSNDLGTSYALDLKASYKFGDDMKIRFTANIMFNNPISIYFSTYHIL